MYVAIHSFSFRDWFKQDKSFDIFQAIDMAEQMGFGGMEIMTGGAGSPPSDVGTDTVGGLKKLVRYAEDHGIKVNSYAPYNDFSFVKNEEWRLANIEYIKKWLRLAGQTGVPNIRMLTGQQIPGEDPQRLAALVDAGIAECIPVAEEAGVNMAVENHNSIYMAGREIVDLIERLGSERLTTCPDPSNACSRFFAPDRTDAERDGVYANLEVMAPYATASHLKVKGLAADGSLACWDLPRLLGIYRAAGFDGAITFESIAEGDLLGPMAEARRVLENAIAASDH
jgi:sugar phosphate isomerase/epimerase